MHTWYTCRSCTWWNKSQYNYLGMLWTVNIMAIKMVLVTFLSKNDVLLSKWKKQHTNKSDNNTNNSNTYINVWRNAISNLLFFVYCKIVSLYCDSPVKTHINSMEACLATFVARDILQRIWLANAKRKWLVHKTTDVIGYNGNSIFKLFRVRSQPFASVDDWPTTLTLES